MGVLRFDTPEVNGVAAKRLRLDEGRDGQLPFDESLDRAWTFLDHPEVEIGRRRRVTETRRADHGNRQAGKPR